jgi:ribose transport system permease protein
VTGFRFWRTREFGTALVLAAMLIACEIAKRVNTHDSFLLSDELPQLFKDASFVGIAAIGACMVIISGGVDLSSGSVMSLAAVTFGYLLQILGWPGPVALFLGILAGGIIGVLNGLLVGKLALPPFIATLGFLSIARGISYWVTGGPVIPLNWRGDNSSGLFALLADYTPWVMLALGAATAALLARFSWGRYVYAVGGNEEAARFSGLRVDWIKVGIYAAAGFFSGFAGSAMALRYGTAYVAIANGYELRIIAACAIGGISFSGGHGSVAGALLGAVTLQVLEILLIQLRVKAEYIDIAYGSAIILAVAIDLLRTGGGLRRWFGRKTT